MSTDEKKNEERQVSRRQLLKTGVGLIGADCPLATSLHSRQSNRHCLRQSWETNRWWG